MDIAVSPYHLTTREAAAMAALLLGRRVLTMLPAPVDVASSTGDAGGVSGMSALQAAAKIPTYRRFVESWAWTTPLWESGVLQYSREGETLVNDMWAVTQHIDEDHECVALRHFTRKRDYPDEGAYLSAVAADLLKGGPDPGISVPVAAALDRFATRHSILVARSSGPRSTSLAQRAEAKLARPVATFSMPMLMQASAGRILHWREVLAKELSSVSASLRRLSEHVAARRAGNNDFGGMVGRDADALCEATNVLSAAAAERHEELMMGSIDDDVRAVESIATISCVPLPWNAVLTSSVRAIDSLHGAGSAKGNGTKAVMSVGEDEPSTGAEAERAIARYDSVRGKSFLALVVKVVGQGKR